MREAPTTGWRILTSVLLVLALSSSVVAARRLTQTRQPLAVLGDSMVSMARTQIVAAGHDAGYTTSVDGIPGIQLAARMESIDALSTHRSGPVVVELGTNDVLQGASGEQLAARADQAATALEHDPCVVFVAVGILFDLDGRAHAFNQHLADLAAAHHNFHVYDWETEFRGHPDWTTDTVHLRPEHLSQYADGIVDTVRDAC